MPHEKILVLEDDPIVRGEIQNQLQQLGCAVSCASAPGEAQVLLGRERYDLIFADWPLLAGDGGILWAEIHGRSHPPLAVVVVAKDAAESAAAAVREGVFDFLTKPVAPCLVEAVLAKARSFTRLARSAEQLSRAEDAPQGPELLGPSAVMENLRQLVRKVARTQAAVLVQGESGSGKERVARAIHLAGPRAHAPLITVDCAAIPAERIEKELFGPGGGTTAGSFELARGGTLLLKEVGELPLPAQARLLAALQEREREAGSRSAAASGPRVIGTTNRALARMIEQQTFRQDLFFRLNVVPIAVPPLRERIEDIPELAEHFARQAARRHGVPAPALAPEFKAALIGHAWPGNIRELRHALERAVTLAGTTGEVRADYLNFAEPGVGAMGAIGGKTGTGGAPLASTRDEIITLHDVEKQYILRALELCDWNRTQTAKNLDISIRTLRNKLNEYGAGRTKVE